MIGPVRSGYTPAAARDEVKQYAWPAVRQKWLAVYRRLARNR